MEAVTSDLPVFCDESLERRAKNFWAGRHSGAPNPEYWSGSPNHYAVHGKWTAPDPDAGSAAAFAVSAADAVAMRIVKRLTELGTGAVGVVHSRGKKIVNAIFGDDVEYTQVSSVAELESYLIDLVREARQLHADYVRYECGGLPRRVCDVIEQKPDVSAAEIYEMLSPMTAEEERWANWHAFDPRRVICIHTDLIKSIPQDVLYDLTNVDFYSVVLCKDARTVWNSDASVRARFIHVFDEAATLFRFFCHNESRLAASVQSCWDPAQSEEIVDGMLVESLLERRCTRIVYVPKFNSRRSGGNGGAFYRYEPFWPDVVAPAAVDSNGVGVGFDEADCIQEEGGDAPAEENTVWNRPAAPAHAGGCVIC